MLRDLLNLGISFIGSLAAFVIAQHYHLEDHWAERKERLEAERAKRRWVKGSELDKRDRIS